MKSGNFQRPRDNKQELTFRRGLPYSWSAFQSLKTVSGDLRLSFLQKASNLLRLQKLFKWSRLQPVSLQTQERYVLSFQRGERAGFDWVFRQLYPVLVLFAYKITRNHPAAEEIASEAFVKIWLKQSGFSEWMAIRAYLYRTVHNDALKWLKSEQRYASSLTELDYQADSNNQRDHFETLAAVETTRELRTCMKQLPPQCSRVLHLLYEEGMSVKEAANDTGLSLSTVKTQKTRGLMAIRIKLKSLPVLLTLSIALGW